MIASSVTRSCARVEDHFRANQDRSPIVPECSLAKITDGKSEKVRKPYVLTKQRERWTDAEHQLFLESLKEHGRAWKSIEDHIGTKTAVQIRSHAQKFFLKLNRAQTWGTDAKSDLVVPPPRPKRKPVRPYPRKADSIVLVTSPSAPTPHYHSSSPLAVSAPPMVFANQPLDGAYLADALVASSCKPHRSSTTSDCTIPSPAHPAGTSSDRPSALLRNLVTPTTHEGVIPSISSNTEQLKLQQRMYDSKAAKVAAVAAAASAAAAAAAAAVVAAADESTQATLHVSPPAGFPFFGMAPSTLACLAAVKAGMQLPVGSLLSLPSTLETTQTRDMALSAAPRAASGKALPSQGTFSASTPPGRPLRARLAPLRRSHQPLSVLLGADASSNLPLPRRQQSDAAGARQSRGDASPVQDTWQAKGSDDISRPWASQAASRGHTAARAPLALESAPVALCNNPTRPCSNGLQRAGDAGSADGGGSDGCDISDTCHGGDSGEGYGSNPNDNGSGVQEAPSNDGSDASDNAPASSRSQGQGSSKAPLCNVAASHAASNLVLCAGKAHALAHAQANPHASDQQFALQGTSGAANDFQGSNQITPDIQALIMNMLAAELPSIETHQHNKALLRQLLTAQQGMQQPQEKSATQPQSAFEPFAQLLPGSIQGFDGREEGSTLALSRVPSVQRPKARRGALSVSQLATAPSDVSTTSSSSKGVKIGDIQGRSSSDIRSVPGSRASSSLDSEVTGVGGFQPYCNALKRSAASQYTGAAKRLTT